MSVAMRLRHKYSSIEFISIIILKVEFGTSFLSTSSCGWQATHTISLEHIVEQFDDKDNHDKY